MSTIELCDPVIEACESQVYVQPEGPQDLAFICLNLMGHLAIYAIPMLSGSSTTADRLGWPFRMAFFVYLPSVIATFVYILVQENTDSPDFTYNMMLYYERFLSNVVFGNVLWTLAIVWLEAIQYSITQWQGAAAYTVLAYYLQTGLMRRMYGAL